MTCHFHPATRNVRKTATVDRYVISVSGVNANDVTMTS